MGWLPTLDTRIDVPSYLWAVVVTASTTVVAMAKSAYDAYLLGQVSSLALAAFALVFPVMTLAVSVGRGIYTGSSAYFTVEAAPGKAKVSFSKFARAIGVSLLASVVTYALIALLLPLIMPEAQYAKYGEELRSFFRYWGFSIPFMYISANAFAIARNLGYINMASVFTIVGNILGVFVSVALIPRLHLEGAAISILATSLLSTSLCVLLVWRHTEREISGPARISPLVRIALPVSAAHMLQFLSLGAITLVFADYGEHVLGGYALVGRVEQVLLAPQIAFTTVAIITVRRYAEVGPDALMRYLNRVILLMLLVGSAEWLVVYLLKGIVGASLPMDESRLLFDFYVTYLTMSVVMQGTFVLLVTVMNVLHRTAVAFAFSFVTYCLVQPSLAFTFSKIAPAHLVLASVCASWLICALGAYAALRVMMIGSKPLEVIGAESVKT